MKVLNRAARYIYYFLEKHNILILPGVKKDLECLHPGCDQKELCREYYVKKIEKTIMIFAAGSVLSIVLALKASGERKLDDGNVLIRGDISDESIREVVEAEFDGRKEQFNIQLQPVSMNREEADESCKDFCNMLPQLIAGENISLNKVKSNLNLQESYEGYPFYVEWRSGNVDCVTSSGTVRQGGQDTEVVLTAEISYGESEWKEELYINVCAEELTEDERRYRELESSIVITEESTRNQEYMVLPDNFNGIPIIWKRVVEDNSLIIWAGAIIVSISIYMLSDRDLHEELEKRKMQMKREYPDIVHKLALYLGAGMTLQGAYQKIAVEYERKKEDNAALLSPAYEEMLYTCRELRSGISESMAYERFGKRTGIQEYIRLSTLMSQNLKKGSSSLLSRLHEEAQGALAERIQMGRKLGEEASTKLLMPMIMMLGVVMVMVMLPAFSSMGL